MDKRGVTQASYKVLGTRKLVRLFPCLLCLNAEWENQGLFLLGVSILPTEHLAGWRPTIRVPV